MASTIIKTCSKHCEHEYQDKKYGKGRRVHNVGRTTTTCTVCSNKETS